MNKCSSRKIWVKMNEAKLTCFLLAALSSVLKLKGLDKTGDCNLFLQALKDFEQLYYKCHFFRRIRASSNRMEQILLWKTRGMSLNSNTVSSFSYLIIRYGTFYPLHNSKTMRILLIKQIGTTFNKLGHRTTYTADRMCHFGAPVLLLGVEISSCVVDL